MLFSSSPDMSSVVTLTIPVPVAERFIAAVDRSKGLHDLGASLERVTESGTCRLAVLGVVLVAGLWVYRRYGPPTHTVHIAAPGDAPRHSVPAAEAALRSDEEPSAPAAACPCCAAVCCEARRISAAAAAASSPRSR